MTRCLAAIVFVAAIAGAAGCGTTKPEATSPAAASFPSGTPQATSAANDLLTVDSAVSEIDKELAIVDHDLVQTDDDPTYAANALTAQVKTARHLTAEHTTTLLADIGAAHKARADSRSYLLLTPQVHMTIVADAEEFADATLSIVADKLTAAGKDVTAVSAKIADAKGLVDPVAGQVLALAPAGYPASQSTLAADRDALKAAGADIKAAASMARALAG